MLLYLFCFLAAAALLAADQWTKFWVESHMVLEEIRPLLPPVLELHAVHNYGAAWSLFAGARWVLVGVTAAMMLAVAAALLLRLVRHPLGVFSAFLILSGGMGNLLDRIFQGYVVDMLRFPFWTSYPTFNVADMCVVTGCVLWLLYVIFVKEDQKKEAEAASPETEAKSPEPKMDSAPGSAAGPVPETPAAPVVPAAPARPAIDPALLGGSPWKKMFEEEDERDSEENDFSGEERQTEDNRESADNSGDAASGNEEPVENQDDSADGASTKEVIDSEDGASAKEEDDRDEDWDSAENFFGGTPFRMKGRNGRVWP